MARPTRRTTGAGGFLDGLIGTLVSFGEGFAWGCSIFMAGAALVDSDPSSNLLPPPGKSSAPTDVAVDKRCLIHF
eukprot:g3826.t1